MNLRPNAAPHYSTAIAYVSRAGDPEQGEGGVVGQTGQYGLQM